MNANEYYTKVQEQYKEQKAKLKTQKYEVQGIFQYGEDHPAYVMYPVIVVKFADGTFGEFTMFEFNNGIKKGS